MRKFLLLLLIIFSIACKQEKSKKQEENTDNTVSKPVIEKKINSDKLKGLFKIDMTQEDKSQLKGRALTVKKTVTKSFEDLNFTFYGNGIGVGFFDDGQRKYLTQNAISNNKFSYTIKNDSIFMQQGEEEPFFFAVIRDESINQDYFVIDFEGDNKTKTRFGLYKVQDLPPNPLF